MLDYSILYKLYIEENKTAKEVSTILGINILTLKDWLCKLKWMYEGYNEIKLTRKFNRAYKVWGDDIVRPTTIVK